MKKLKDILDTKYIYDDFTGDLDKVCRTEKELDLAGCKFTPSAEAVLKKYYGSVRFINSEDPELNKLLVHNNIAKISHMKDPQLLKLNTNNASDLIRLLQGLDRQGNYIIDFDSIGQAKRIATETIITMMFPEITIDVSIDLKDIFDFSRREWLKCNKHHDEYWYVDCQSLIEVTVRPDGKVHTVDGKTLKESAFLRMYNAMPKDFGTKVIAKDEEYSGIFRACLKILDTKRETEKHMIDFLERR